MTREEQIKQYCAEQGFPYGACSGLSSVKAAIATEAIKWANEHPRPLYIVVRCEEHDDYIEKVFVDEALAKQYCAKYDGNPNEYNRYIVKKDITLKEE